MPVQPLDIEAIKIKMLFIFNIDPLNLYSQQPINSFLNKNPFDVNYEKVAKCL